MDVRFYPSTMATGTSFGDSRRAGRPSRAVGLAILLAASSLSAPGADHGGRRYRIEAGKSFIDVKVGTAGLFRFAGHDHLVRVPVAGGEVVAFAQELSASRVWLRFESASIRVISSEGGAAEIPKVQEKMAGPAVLQVARFPEARFESRRVSGKAGASPGSFELEVEGDLTLKGATRPVSARVTVVPQGRAMVVKGQLRLKQSDFGIAPVSVAGLVKVKDELALALELVAVAEEAE